VTAKGTSAGDDTLARDFGDVEFTLRRLRQGDETFASLIEDYLEAKRALAHWRRSRRRERGERLAEYQEVVTALAAEIRERIQIATKRPQR
jgi:hypothetical protein